MGRVSFSARIVYGTGLYLTISPSERHGGLNIRLSRYRREAPLMRTSSSSQERAWAGQDAPSLQARLGPDGEEITVDLPEYDLRRLILARDPLCSVDAFSVLVRVVLARLLGIRMCPDCPHCNKGSQGCQDAFGSSAEPQGGIFGRCDAIFGGVETQKSGALHLHLIAFLQRVHQHCTLMEIAQMIRKELLSVEALKQYTDWVCNQAYPDASRQAAEAEELERQWPAFRGDRRLGRPPAFIWDDAGPCLNGVDTCLATLRAEGAKWLARYDDAAQYIMQHVQHHVHKRGPDGERRPLTACQKFGKPSQCRHEFPMVERLTDTPKLVCPGVAEQHGLRVSGRHTEN